MSDSQRELGGDPNSGAAEWVPPQSVPPGPGYPPPYPPPNRGGNSGLIIAGVLGLVVVLAVGLLIGFVVGGGMGTNASAGESTTVPPGPGTYSMNGVTNACDLVDTAPLTRWSPTPEHAPAHEETLPTPSSDGLLRCEVDYTSRTGDELAEFSLNEAGMLVEAEVAAGEPSFGHLCTKPARTGVTIGKITGLGSRACWISDVYGDLVQNISYTVEVEDGNIGVRVRINLTREQGSPPVSRSELDTVARSQVRRTLDGLREN